MAIEEIVAIQVCERGMYVLVCVMHVYFHKD